LPLILDQLTYHQFVWGCLVIAYVGINDKNHLIGLRLVLGIVEAGFFPGILLYMSFWYKKMELARRFSIFYSASLLAGAFGGLLAGAILSGLNGAKGLPAWKWLFVSKSPRHTTWLCVERPDHSQLNRAAWRYCAT
jgi:MFS family permease